MAVLIKGMEMPSGCNVCAFMTKCGICEGYSDFCILVDDRPTHSEWEEQPESRPDYCPLVEIKTPQKANIKLLEESGFEV